MVLSWVLYVFAFITEWWICVCGRMFLFLTTLFPYVHTTYTTPYNMLADLSVAANNLLSSTLAVDDMRKSSKNSETRISRIEWSSEESKIITINTEMHNACAHAIQRLSENTDVCVMYVCLFTDASDKSIQWLIQNTTILYDFFLFAVQSVA